RVQAVRALRVVDAALRPIAGEGRLGADQTSWQFLPDQPWAGTDVTLLDDARLEDVAGNNFREALDHGLDSESLEIDQVSLGITLGPAVPLR
ncbi:MAG: hypothetical protein AAF281_16075, partial [Pseudomonadota bacterium]